MPDNAWKSYLFHSNVDKNGCWIGRKMKRPGVKTAGETVDSECNLKARKRGGYKNARRILQYVLYVGL
jgi:hypothetical protein